MFIQEFTRRGAIVGLIALVLLVLIGGGSPALGDTTAADLAAAAGRLETKSGAQAGAPSGALAKLQVHGFFTQAYAESTYTGSLLSTAELTSDENALGIPEGGTTDYRFLALQFRQEITDLDTLTIQLSHRAIGESPLDDAQPDFVLDWAFYQRRLGDNAVLKVGRIPIAMGIFNEVRDVGTVLPFYRPAYVFYREGFATTESVDGLNFSYSFFSASDWVLDIDLYGGGWDSFDLTATDAIPARMKDSWGGWLWLNTKLPGLRFGAGVQNQHIFGGLEGSNRREGESTSIDEIFFSVDYATEHFVFRSEYRNTTNDPTFFPAPGADDFEVDVDNYYVQVGFHPTDAIRLYAQYEVSDFLLISPSRFLNSVDYVKRTDLGFSLAYSISPQIVVKGEYHIAGGEEFSMNPVFLPTGFFLDPFYEDLEEGDYTIISLSVAF